MGLVLLGQYLICKSELVPDSDQLSGQRDFGAISANLQFTQLSVLRFQVLRYDPFVVAFTCQ